MYDVEHFTMRDMTECGAALRRMSEGAADMEQVAQRIVRHLYDYLIDRRSGERATILVRFFKTHPFGTLPTELRVAAQSMLDCHAAPDMKCLTLLATAGLRPEWNRRQDSVGHQAIPLPDAVSLSRTPMIQQLFIQLGVNADDVLAPNPERLLELAQQRYSVLHVPEAKGSPFIPAQADFVIPMKVRSVLGFGGPTPSADLFAVIVFSRTFIPSETAEMFRTIALNLRIALLQCDGRSVFHSQPPVLAGDDAS